MPRSNRPAGAVARPRRSITALVVLVLLAGLAVVIAPAARAATTPSVSGQVTAADGSPVAGAKVEFLSEEEDGWWGRGSATTGADGRYVRSGMTPRDNYVLQVRATGYAPRFWGGALTRDTAATLAVGADQAVTGIDVSLQRAASVSGTVTTATGDPAAGVFVQAVRVDDPLPATFGGDGAGLDGTYALSGLPAGTYTLRFSGGVGQYPRQYLGGTVLVADASTFTVGVGESITGRSDSVAALPAGGGSISGTVTDEAGEPLSGASVMISTPGAAGEDALGGESIYTAADGTYAFPALAPGTYDVQFAKGGHASEYWKDSTVVLGDPAPYEQRTPLVLGTGDAFTGIDASLELGIRVAVTVVTGDGTPVVGADVASVLIEGGAVAKRTPAGQTDEDGRVVLDHLADGTYTVEVEGGTPELTKQYRGATGDLSEAQTFRVEWGWTSPVTVVAALDGSVSGTVRLPNGQPALGAEVTLVKLYNLGWGPVTSKEVDGPQTVDVQGRYAFENLPHGYTIRVDAPGFPTQYLGGMSSAATARYFGLDLERPLTDLDHTLRSIDDLDPVASQTTIALSTSPADTRAYGVASTATATVTSSLGPGTGTVVFKDLYTTVIATAELVDGTATVTIPADLTPGTHGISAHYLGSGDLTPSETAARALHVGKAPSSTSVTLETASRGWGTASTARIDAWSPIGAATGSVTLYDGDAVFATVPLVDGQAVVELPATMPGGEYDLHAVYGGSSQLDGSASAHQAFTVTRHGTDVDLELLPASRAYGTASTARVEVSSFDGGPVPGEVRLFGTTGSDTELLVTAPLVDGEAVIELSSSLRTGTHVLRAVYVQSDGFQPGVSDNRTLTVTPAATTTSLELTPSSRAYGSASTAEIDVTSTAGTPSGTVTVYAGTTPVATATTSQGHASVPLPASLAVGAHVLHATFGGAGSYAPSTSATGTLTVTAAPTSTTVTLAASSRPYGQANTATVKVTSAAGVPTGTVVLKEGSVLLGSATLVGGRATITIPRLLAVRAHSVRVEYRGSATFRTSASSARWLTVTKATATASASAAKPTVSTTARAQVNVIVRAPGVVPGGRVTVSLGGKVLRTANLGGGGVALRLPTLKRGTHTLTVRYAGSATVKSDATTVRLKVTR